jgi:hypothetical protein
MNFINFPLSFSVYLAAPYLSYPPVFFLLPYFNCKHKREQYLKDLDMYIEGLILKWFLK